MTLLVKQLSLDASDILGMGRLFMDFTGGALALTLLVIQAATVFFNVLLNVLVLGLENGDTEIRSWWVMGKGIPCRGWALLDPTTPGRARLFIKPRKKSPRTLITL